MICSELGLGADTPVGIRLLLKVPSELFAFLLVCGLTIGVYGEKIGFGGTGGPPDKDWQKNCEP